MTLRPTTALVLALGLGAAGCASRAPLREYNEVAHNLQASALRPPESIPLDAPEAIALDPAPTPPELTGPQPVDPFIHRALQENRMVQAARYNLLAMKARIPQVTALDDPVVSNTIYPIPSVAPQYSLMGYNPYNLMLAQQFPWFGTLGLRGLAAGEDVKVALAELAAAQLDAVANVKRAYFDLAFNEQAERILLANREIASDFVEFAKVRVRTGGSQQDFLRAEVVVSDLDRELVRIRQGVAEARADLAQLLHISPETDLRTLPNWPVQDVPAQIDRLYRLAAAARPELRGRLA
ncbi:MAG: TolC family protein, partial [Isosphaeraceae bacterium]|nr:TolC family protein [Isosphaeraceae bacterium]